MCHEASSFFFGFMSKFNVLINLAFYESFSKEKWREEQWTSRMKPSCIHCISICLSVKSIIIFQISKGAVYMKAGCGCLSGLLYLVSCFLFLRKKPNNVAFEYYFDSIWVGCTAIDLESLHQYTQLYNTWRHYWKWLLT